jgi:hypothetical protein
MKRLPIVMTLKEAEAVAGRLGHPSKMPGYSYGISAQRCITGSKLRALPGSVCRSCYAMTDWYRSWKPLLMGHQRRWDGLRRPAWVDAMVTMISIKCQPPNDYFRWHDSGDLQGVWHLENIAAVCERTPGVKHWLPTRETPFVQGFIATGKAIPANLVIRISAMFIDAEPVLPVGLSGFATSAVSTAPESSSKFRLVEGKGSIECRAVETRDNKCGDCRACWDARVSNVTYPQH